MFNKIIDKIINFIDESLDEAWKFFIWWPLLVLFIWGLSFLICFIFDLI